MQEANIFDHVNDLINIYSEMFPDLKAIKLNDEMHENILKSIETMVLAVASNLYDRLGEIKSNDVLRRSILHLLSEAMSVLSIDRESSAYKYVSTLIVELFVR